MSKDANEGFDASHCSTALIVYQPPSKFTAIEQAIWDNGTNAEKAKVLTAVCLRAFGIPSQLVESGDTNYSSGKIDLRLWKNRQSEPCTAWCGNASSRDCGSLNAVGTPQHEDG